MSATHPLRSAASTPAPGRRARTPGRLLAAVLVAGSLLHTAPLIAQAEADPQRTLAAAEARDRAAEVRNDPSPAASTVNRTGPRLLNAEQLALEIRRQYVGWIDWDAVDYEVDLLVQVDAQGRVKAARIARSSGRFLVDRAIREAAAVMQFTPATHDGEGAEAWLTLPVVHRRPATAAQAASGQ
jgi:TonB family protein